MNIYMGNLSHAATKDTLEAFSKKRKGEAKNASEVFNLE